MSQQQPGSSNRRFTLPRPTRTGGIVIQRMHEALPNQQSQPLPTPTGQPPYHLSLDSVLTPAQIQAINDAGKFVFHVVGDTGGVKAPQSQEIVMLHMDDDLNVADATARPVFFYHLGDVVYYYGQVGEYYSQFYEPNMHYAAPILGIPGNHDGDVIDPSVPSLAAYVENFCATTPHLTTESGDSGRDAMTQPNVYWTLETPFITFIGLYTNVPEGGWVDADQAAWLASELTNAPQNKALIVAMHHPIYSADIYHSGSAFMAQLLDGAIHQTNRIPDVVFAGHVHNYQRYTRSLNGRDIPYVVAGAGGYWHLHSMMKPQGQPIQTPYPMPAPDSGVTLESYLDNRHGYMRMEVTAQTLKGEYYSVPRPQESWSAPAQLVDSFTLDLTQHRVS